MTKGIDFYITLWYTYYIGIVIQFFNPNLTLLGQPTRGIMHPDNHTDSYLFGYADALDGALNLAAFTTSKDYQQGYGDAVHDTAFTVIDEDTF